MQSKEVIFFFSKYLKGTIQITKLIQLQYPQNI